MYPLTTVVVAMLVVNTGPSFRPSYAQHDPPDCNPAGRFGSQCQFVCHCQSQDCHPVTGECTKCHKGYFGPGCQYIAAEFFYNGIPPELTDHDDKVKTCVDPSVTNVTIILKDAIPFTWLRGTTRPSDISYPAPTLQLFSPFGRPDQQIPCVQTMHEKKAGNFFDLYCVTGVAINKVILEGALVSRLCAVKISRGRNVALGQPTSQDSTRATASGPGQAAPSNISLTPWSSGHAVDGAAQSGLGGLEHVCSSTSLDTNPATFRINFTTPVLLGDILIRVPRPCSDCAATYVLVISSLGQDYRFGWNASNPAQYAQLQPTDKPAYTEPIFAISVEKPAGGTTSAIFLCELEVMGELVCPYREYGLECHSKCHCRDVNETCHVANGACPSECKPGYETWDCGQECQPHTFGENCTSSCSNLCKDEICHHVTGRCIKCADGTSDCQDRDGDSPGDVEHHYLGTILGMLVFSALAVAVLTLTILTCRYEEIQRNSRDPGAPTDTFSFLQITAPTVGKEDNGSVPAGAAFMKQFVESTLASSQLSNVSVPTSMHRLTALDIGTGASADAEYMRRMSISNVDTGKRRFYSEVSSKMEAGGSVVETSVDAPRN